MREYMSELNNLEQIPQEQLVPLIEQAQAGRTAEKQLSERGRPCVELSELAAEGVAARNRVMVSFLPLVVSIATRLNRCGQQEMLDMVSEGNLAVIAAIYNYRGDFIKDGRPVKFITYASKAIATEMLKARRQRSSHDNQVRVPDYLWKLIKRKQAGEKLRKKLMVSVEAAERVLAPMVDCYDTDIAKNEPADYWLTVGEEHKVNYEATEMVLHSRVISSVERRILVGYYMNGKTLRQLGDALHLTKERVRQIKHCALDKLRNRHAEEYHELCSAR